MSMNLNKSKRKIQHPTRRNVLQGAAAASAAVAAGPFIATPGKAQASAVLRVADDGGQTHDGRLRHYLEPYMRETGVEIQTYLGERGLARMSAMIATDNLEFDITNDLATTLLAASHEGFLEPIDYDRLDTERHNVPEWMWENTLAFQFYTGGIGYNTNVIAAEDLPSTWAEFFDTEAFAGRRGLMARPNETLELALMADGVAPADLYPLDLDRAFASLDRIKDQIAIWVAQTPKTIEHIMTGELDYCYTYSGRVEIARGQDFPTSFIYELPISSPQNFAIMKGVQNYDLCMEFIGWWLTNEEASINFYSEFIGQAPTDGPSYEALPEEVKARLPDPLNAQACWINPDYWGENIAEISERFQLWQLT